MKNIIKYTFIIAALGGVTAVIGAFMGRGELGDGLALGGSTVMALSLCAGVIMGVAEVGVKAFERVENKLPNRRTPQ